MSVAIDDVDPPVDGTSKPGRRKRVLSTGQATSRSLSSQPGRIIVYVLMFMWTVPTFGILVSSFRSEIDVKTSGWWKWFTDPSITLENYRRVLSSAPGDDNMAKFFMNSLIITIPSVILSVGIALLASYALRRCRPTRSPMGS